VYLLAPGIGSQETVMEVGLTFPTLTMVGTANAVKANEFQT